MAATDVAREERRERWRVETDVPAASGHLGTRLVHYYSVPRGIDPDDLSWSRGAAMPDAPAGDGHDATIESVHCIGVQGKHRRLMRVTGFQAKARP